MSDRIAPSRSPLLVRRDPAGRASVAAEPTRAAHISAAKRGFTLVELMVSMAIAVIVILGIQQVFSIGAKTISAGQAISTMNRDNRAVQAVFNADLASADTSGDCPAFMIRSAQAYAFASASDKAGASNPNDPSQDPNFAAATPANTIPVTFYNYRNHRLDRIAFFARNFFQRQTGGDDSGNNQLIDRTTSNEAYIWYGHLGQPSNNWLAQQTGTANPNQNANWFEPGDKGSPPNDVNDNNLYASDWILGRVAMLLVGSPTSGSDSYITTGKNSLDPLVVWPETSASQPANPVSGISQYLWQGRYDQALTSIASYGLVLNNTNNWGTGSPYAAWSTAGNAYGTGSYNWYEQMIGGPPTGGTPSFSGRFQANPFPLVYAAGKGPGSQTGLTNSSLAKTFPIFLRGCTQFIVEYSGNYYTKYPDNSGNPLFTKNANGTYSSPPDPTGQMDYEVTSSGVKQIRWYGFPRHTNGNAATSIFPSTDVVPLGAFLQASLAYEAGNNNYSANSYQSGTPIASGAALASLPLFERYYSPSGSSVATWPPTGVTFGTDYSLNGNVPAPTVSGQTGSEYVAAWGPDTAADVNSPLPKMIRITVAMGDPNGNVTTPQWFEYVINLNP